MSSNPPGNYPSFPDPNQGANLPQSSQPGSYSEYQGAQQWNAAPQYQAPAQYNQSPFPGYTPQYPIYIQTQPSIAGPVIAEAICSFFGFFGIGWLASGRTTPGVIMLVGSFFYWGIMATLVIFTLGLGALCVFPIHLVLIAVSSATLANRIKQGI